MLLREGLSCSFKQFVNAKVELLLCKITINVFHKNLRKETTEYLEIM